MSGNTANVAMNLKFIQLVKEEPFLYNGLGKSNDCNAKWLEISKKMTENVDENASEAVKALQMKWKNLRDGYARNHKKELQNKKFKPSIYYKELHFLKDYISHKENLVGSQQSRVFPATSEIEMLDVANSDAALTQNDLAAESRKEDGSKVCEPQIERPQKLRITSIQTVLQKIPLYDLPNSNTSCSPEIVANYQSKLPHITGNATELPNTSNSNFDALLNNGKRILENTNKISEGVSAADCKESAFQKFPINPKRKNFAENAAEFERLVTGNAKIPSAQDQTRNTVQQHEFTVPAPDNFRRRKRPPVPSDGEEKCFEEISKVLESLKKYYDARYAILLKESARQEHPQQNVSATQENLVCKEVEIDQEMFHYEKLLLRKFEEVPLWKKISTFKEIIQELRK